MKNIIIILLIFISGLFGQQNLGDDEITVESNKVTINTDTTEVGVLNAGNALSNSNYIIEGSSTERTILRALSLRVSSDDPGVSIDVEDRSNLEPTLNQITIIDADDMAVSGTSGSFSLSADGKTITHTTTETAKYIVSYSPYKVDINASDGSVAFIKVLIVGGNLTYNIYPQGSTNVSWLTQFDDAGDQFVFIAAYTTSD